MSNNADKKNNSWRAVQVATDIEKHGLRRADVTYDILKLINPNMYGDIPSAEKEKFHSALGNIKKQSVRKYVLRLKEANITAGEGTNKELVESDGGGLPDLSGLIIDDNVAATAPPSAPPKTPPNSRPRRTRRSTKK